MSDTGLESRRNGTLDAVKILMALLVVGIHENPFYEFSESAGYLTGNGLFRIAVPFFLITNGYFYFKADRSRKRAWLRHLVLMYLFWMAVYAPFWLAEVGQPASPTAVIKVLFHNGYHHLWYLLAALYAVLCAECIECFKLRPHQTLLVAMALLCLGYATQTFAAYTVVSGVDVPSITQSLYATRNFLFLGLPFVLIGKLLATRPEYQIQQDRTACFMIGVGALILVGESMIYFNSFWNSAYSWNMANNDIYLSVAIISPAIFCLALNHPWNTRHRFLGTMANGIYLVHPLMVAAFATLTLTSWQRLLMVCVASAILAYCMTLLPKPLRFMT
ncbi:MAG: acyltransferase [Phycisphaeraceae bacterium]